MPTATAEPATTITVVLLELHSATTVAPPAMAREAAAIPP